MIYINKLVEDLQKLFPKYSVVTSYQPLEIPIIDGTKNANDIISVVPNGGYRLTSKASARYVDIYIRSASKLQLLSDVEQMINYYENKPNYCFGVDIMMYPKVHIRKNTLTEYFLTILIVL